MVGVPFFPPAVVLLLDLQGKISFLQLSPSWSYFWWLNLAQVCWESDKKSDVSGENHILKKKKKKEKKQLVEFQSMRINFFGGWVKDMAGLNYSALPTADLSVQTGGKPPPSTPKPQISRCSEELGN